MTQIDDFMAHIFHPGAVHLTSGTKGGGKSHTAIAVAEQLVHDVYPSVGKVVVATNITMYHQCGDLGNEETLIEDTPENIHHIETMEELFPIVADTIEKYGREKVLILLILDEAQNFLLGDLNYGNLTVAMKEFMGIIRKFNMAVWFLTPSDRNIGPAFRNFMNDDNDPGNVTVKWRKDLAINTKYINAKKLEMDPKELIAVKSYDMDPVFLRIPITEWTKTWKTTEKDGYCYDHESSATFKVGNFDFLNFNDRMGGVSSIKAMSTIRAYYKEHEIASEDKINAMQNIENERVANVTYRLRKLGLTWDAISFALDVPVTTLQRKMKNNCTISENNEDDDENSIKNETNKQKSIKKINKSRLKKNNASKKTNHQTRGGLASNIYLSNGKGSKECILGDPRLKDDFEKSSENGSNEINESRIDTSIPNGKYTFDELNRAADCCLSDSD